MLGVGLWMTGLPLGFHQALRPMPGTKWVGLVVLVLTVGRLFVALAAIRRRRWPRRGWCAGRRWLAPIRPLDVAGAVARPLPISGWLMSSAAGVSVFWLRLHSPARPWCRARPPPCSTPLRTTHYILSRLLIAGAGASCRRRRAPRRPAARRRLFAACGPFGGNLMRRWPILALLLLASPAIAGPQDAWEHRSARQFASLSPPPRSAPSSTAASPPGQARSFLDPARARPRRASISRSRRRR